VGGVVVNLFLGFFIYAMTLWYWGEEYIPTNKFTYGITADSLAQSIGLRDGDKLLAVDGKYIEKFRKVPTEVILKNAKAFRIDRDGQQLDIPIPADFGGKLIKYKDLGFIDIRVPFVRADSVLDTSVAAKAGIRKGDRILKVNDTSIAFFHEFVKKI